MYTSEILAQFVAELQYERIPEKTLDNARGRVLDFISSAAAGYTVNGPMNEIVYDTVRALNASKDCGVYFGNGRLSVTDAAFMNAFYGHGADLDDGHMLSSGHPGVGVVPACLALAEYRSLSAQTLLTAVVAGYEVYVRVSNAIMPSHLHRGFHGTGTVGAVACAAAAAKMLCDDPQAIHRAISLGAVAASGLFEVSESGQAMKPINPANAARTGILSALLAVNGADAPLNPFEGKRGFFKAFADQLKLDEITQDLGTAYRIDSCYLKMYPACRHMHGLIDCAVALREQGGFTPDDIEKIRLCVYENSIRVTGNIREPVDPGEAKFSQTYGVAIGLTTGNYTLADIARPEEMSDTVRSLIRKMEIVCDPTLEVRAQMIRGARVEIVLKNGRTLVHEVRTPKGEAVTPFTREDMRRKLAACAEGVLEEQAQDRVFNACMTLGKGCQVPELLGLLVK